MDEGHEGVGQLPEPLLHQASDRVQGVILQTHRARTCRPTRKEENNRETPHEEVRSPTQTVSMVTIYRMFLTALLWLLWVVSDRSPGSGGVPSCGWRSRTCGRCPQCTARSSPRAPASSPSPRELGSCHWSGDSPAHRSAARWAPRHSEPNKQPIVLMILYLPEVRISPPE